MALKKSDLYSSLWVMASTRRSRFGRNDPADQECQNLRIRGARWTERKASNRASRRSGLAEAKQYEFQGSVLVTFDAPLGVPASYLAALSDIPASGAPKNFLEFMQLACAIPEFFDATSVAGH